MGKRETPKFVVDEKWLSEQEERIKFLTGLKPKDRLDAHGYIMKSLQISGSQIQDIFQSFNVLDLALTLDEKSYMHVFEELRSLSLAIIHLNSEVTRLIPTKGAETERAETSAKEATERLFS